MVARARPAIFPPLLLVVCSPNIPLHGLVRWTKTNPAIQMCAPRPSTAPGKSARFKRALHPIQELWGCFTSITWSFNTRRAQSYNSGPDHRRPRAT